VSGMLPYLGALALFLACLRLSAFFSGAETGFYRVSYLRVSIDAQAGDSAARRILWFCQNPSDFVVTALVGNNVAQYGLTAAVGIAVAHAGVANGMTTEIVSTLFIAPFAFAFGELIPKNLYYRAPLWLLRRNVKWFDLFYWVFFPIGFPLVAVARVMQRFTRKGTERPGEILGRARLVQVLSQGHQEGLLLDVQSRLLEGLMHLAGQPVMQSVIPNSRVLGVADNVAREDVLNFARRYGVNSVAVCRPGVPDSWYGYLRVIDIALTQQPLASLVRRMPVIGSGASKLEALLTLRTAAAVYGVVMSNDRVLGLASENGLSEQLFRAPQTSGARGGE
jgi:putative hemolysin